MSATLRQGVAIIGSYHVYGGDAILSGGNEGEISITGNLLVNGKTIEDIVNGIIDKHSGWVIYDDTI